MKKQIFFLLMAFVVCQGLKAQNIGGLKYFNLVLPDNSLVSYELANGVDIHFQDSIMVVNDLNFCMEGGMKYYFSEGNEVAISDVMGRMVYSTAGCEECVVDLSSLAPNTLYVIRINNQSIKFLKR